MDIPGISGEIPSLTVEQMIAVDRVLIDFYGIDLIQMMENAGRCLSILATSRFLGGSAAGRSVVVLTGTGGNGGGALAAARRLHNWGASVKVFTTSGGEKMKPVTRQQFDILNKMGVPIFSGGSPETSSTADLLIDGIIGYSVSGSPYGVPKRMIDWLNHQSAPVLSLDTPSGLDLTSGLANDPTVRADATLTLALPKKGLFEVTAKEFRGELYLGDISVPPGLYTRYLEDIRPPNGLFSSSDVLRILA